MAEHDLPPRKRSNTLLNASNQHAGGSRYQSPSIGEESDLQSGPSSSDMEMEEMRSDDGLEDDEETGLTHSERKKRRRQKDKKSRLDERTASSGGMDSTTMAKRKEEEEKTVTASVIKSMLINALLIGMWYSFSISISVYNKWMFSSENLDFHFPLFTTSLHMVVQFSLASAVLYCVPRLRPTAANPEQDGHVYTRLDGDGAGDGHDGDENHTPQNPSPKPRQPLMTKWFYFTRIAPCGTATALDIGLGNFSLRFISLTFFTMCKSSVLAFVLLFAFLFRLEQPTWKLCAIIALMTAGVIMMVAGELAFNALGFMLVMTASFCSGFRWSLTQILLLRNRATSNPFSTIFFTTPVMFLALIILALPIEGPAEVLEGIRTLSDNKGAAFSFLLLLFPGFLAFLMVAAEFALLQRSSVVTLSVCGIFKEVLTISAAGAVFGDELSPINVSGLAVTVASIAGYNYLKYLAMRQEAKEEVAAVMAEVESAAGKGFGEVSENDRGRASTSGLMRESLYPALDEDGGGGALVSGHRHAISVSKRPQDVE